MSEPRRMRVVSLLPAATEMVAALGAGGSLVGISHECDWPPSVRHLPRVTTTPVDASRSSAEIDTAVRRALTAGRPVIAVDAVQLLALRPDLVLTQDLCEVCAVSDGDVRTLAATFETPPRLLRLRGRTLSGVFGDISAVGAALDAEDEAEEVVEGLRDRLQRLGGDSLPVRPRVICIEWLDPLYLAGHWVPEQIAAAGGQDVGAEPGTHSRTTTLPELEALAPDVVLVAPCGFGLPRAREEYRRFEAGVRAGGGRPPSGWGAAVWLLDGNAYTSRPGPRLVDGAGRIAALLRGRELPGAMPWRALRDSGLPTTLEG